MLQYVKTILKNTAFIDFSFVGNSYEEVEMLIEENRKISLQLPEKFKKRYKNYEKENPIIRISKFETIEKETIIKE